MFSFTWVLSYWEIILNGVVVTSILTLLGAVVGVTLGVFCNRACLQGGSISVFMFRSFVELIRNTPFLIQLFFIFFGLPAIGIKLSPLFAAFLATSINVAAYSADIIRAGLQVAKKGQLEGAYSLGMSKVEAFWHILLPPALQRVWPALSSQLVLVMLGSAVVSQISVEDLSAAANFIQSRNFRAFETYFFLTIIYMLLAVAYRYLLGKIGNLFFSRGMTI